MKRILILSFMFLFMLSATQVVAQDKVKVKDDKTKVKDGDAKTKTKDDKTKVKDGDDKTKMKDDKMKMKDGDDKTKITDDKTKIKDGDDKTKITDDKMKMKDGDDKTKITDDKMKVQDNDGTIKIKGEDGMNTMSNMNPYTASYSSNFVMGNSAHSAMILDMWKDWDDNAFDRHNYWADTVSVFLSDGMVIKGRDSAVAGAKRYRGSLASAKSTITSIVPLRSADRNEDWVAIWGTETDTWPDGKVENMQIHEIWRINKDGKIDFMRQYTAKASPQQ
jgi:hypothetical protein